MKHLVIPAILHIYTVIPVTLHVTQRNNARWLSSHIADTRLSIIYMAIVTPLAVLMLIGWYGSWYVQEYSPSLWLTGVFGIGMLSCVILSWVPFREGTWKYRVHGFFRMWDMPDLCLLSRCFSRYMLSKKHFEWHFLWRRSVISWLRLLQRLHGENVMYSCFNKPMSGFFHSCFSR